MKTQPSFEFVDDIVVLRWHGEPTADLFMKCHEHVTSLIGDRSGKILYDGRTMPMPSVDLVLLQQKLEFEKAAVSVRNAIVVSSCRLAYLSRIAFGDGDYRVFYDDIEAAMNWLQSEEF
jgi:hypothetical protein